ncbi:MAG: hypothetical protein H6585_06260 [Flavobacteriales bacterium]|nr:hypothetical protein [Flavobacteriales bacterium]MCB9447931.1 hypothetical protein [Flavobacteriales bacterium]
MTSFRNPLIGIACLSIVLGACKNDLDKASWDVGVLAPLVKTSIGIDDLITDSLLQKTPDNTVSLVYQTGLYEFTLDQMYTMPDTTFTYNVQLQYIEMGDRSIVYPITLGQIARETGGATGAFILASHGNSVPVPPISGISSNNMPIDANEFFESVTLISGWMDIELKNELPIPITNLVFQLKNQSNGVVIVRDTFPYIPPNTTVIDSADLSGQTVYGDMLGQILNMESPGSGGNPVPIDTNDALIATITVRDLNPYSATAVFPDQDIVNETQEMPLKNADNLQLNYIIIRDGFVKIDVVSTLQDTLRFDYKIPSATFQGVPFEVITKVPPAPPGGTSVFSKLYDFTGYKLDLTGINGDTVNTWYQSLIGRIDSTGNSTTLALTDSFYVNAGLVDVVPEYGYGYLGQDVYDIGPSVVPVELFKGITAGNIDLEKVKVTMDVVNSIGLDANVVLKSLISKNTSTGNTVPLSSSFLDSTVTIAEATDNPLTPAVENIEISGLEPLVENLPDEMEYQLKLQLNPNTPPPPIGTGTDFIYHDHGIRADLNIEMPLSLVANQLTLTDTSDFDLGNNNPSEDRKIKDGTFTLLVDNGFPFDALITLDITDGAGNVLDQLMMDQMVAAAQLDAGNRVSQKKLTQIKLPVNEARMNKLYNGNKIVIKAAFTTAGQPDFVKIYSNYTIDFKLVGDFNYRL